jgi:hypothetical protein
MVLERIGKGEEGQAVRDRATALSEAGQRTA